MNLLLTRGPQNQSQLEVNDKDKREIYLAILS